MADKSDEPTRLPPPPFWRTRYFANEVLSKPGRANIDVLDILRIIRDPVHRQVQDDGRIRLWGWSYDLNAYVRVILLADGETVHNCFQDDDFVPRR